MAAILYCKKSFKNVNFEKDNCMESWLNKVKYNVRKEL